MKNHIKKHRNVYYNGFVGACAALVINGYELPALNILGAVAVFQFVVLVVMCPMILVGAIVLPASKSKEVFSGLLKYRLGFCELVFVGMCDISVLMAWVESGHKVIAGIVTVIIVFLYLAHWLIRAVAGAVVEQSEKEEA